MRGMMRAAVCGVLLLGLTSAASAQSTVTAIDVTGLQDGQYVLTVRNGQATIQSLRLLTIGPVPTPVPGPTPNPTPVPVLSDRAKAIQAAARLVQSDPDRAGTAQALALMYSQLADAIRAGKLGTDPTAMAAAVKMTTDLLLTQRGATAPAAWAPVRDLLSDQWSEVARAGGNAASYAELVTDAAKGLSASVPADRQNQLDPAIIELIMQIIQIVLKLLIK